ncbi:hypothetical protein DUNSADRAFT_2830 [Dunaliella salina]|uniref:Uncharacterized protein n=1 Tax=Dunaliella salina TaxID=3046 RepID=A0ABQ7FVV5_DUNSA|nr:hypothetical protein DUNSADRAFT_2830 [Dunaliella salina]|eukprot:KAF5826518.1 hypothetical protein DUNSADRAFT_2830 [Dunaliella salina]
MEVGGEPVVNWWLKSLRDCPRLLPVSGKVTIVTSPSTHADYTEWANNRRLSLGGFEGRVLANPEAIDGAPMQDLLFALQQVPGLSNSYVMVASLDYFFGPSLPLRQLVEHSVIRGKDALVFAQPPPGESIAGRTEVHFDLQGTTTVTGECKNPKIADLDLDAPNVEADGLSTSVLAPMCIIHKSTAGALASSGLDPGLTPGPKQLARFMKQLCNTKPVYGFHIDMSLPVDSSDGYMYAKTFMEYYQSHISKVASRGVAAEAQELLTRTARDQGLATSMDEGVENLMRRSSQVKQVFLKYSVEAGDILAAKEDAIRRQEEAAATGAAPVSMVKYGVRDELPLRFRDPSTLRHKPKIQHPVFTTTANEIGLRKPDVTNLPDVYAGSAGGFTKTFTGGPYRNEALVTSTTKSKVHRLLDDF